MKAIRILTHEEIDVRLMPHEELDYKNSPCPFCGTNEEHYDCDEEKSIYCPKELKII